MSSEVNTAFARTLLKGQRAVVSGAGTGIGRAIAESLARAGADLLLVARRQDLLQAASTQLKEETGRDVGIHTVNIRDRSNVEELGRHVSEIWGAPTILVNNAGGQFPAAARAISPNGWRAVIETNLFGTWNMTQVLGGLMLDAGGGAICQIVVVQGRGMPGLAHTAAARSGIVELTRTLAFEWGPRVRLNCVAPGSIQTTGFEKAYDDSVYDGQEGIPIPRFGEAREVADAVTFLVSPAASYITGTVLHVDGGSHLQGPMQAMAEFPDRRLSGSAETNVPTN